MAKVYSKGTWVDEVLSGAERYDIKTNAGATVELNAQIDLATSVAVAGTPMDAAKMNNIENGIDALDNALVAGNAANIHAATGKTTPVDADEVELIDSAASNVMKKLTWANIKATLKAYFDTLYAVAAKGVTNGDSHDHNGGDGAQIDHATLANKGTNTHAQIDTFMGKTILTLATQAVTLDSNTAGAVTITASMVTVDTFNNQAAGDLATINGGNTGDILVMTLVNNAHKVTFRETGNLRLNTDFAPQTIRDTIVLVKLGTLWLELCRSLNG